MTTTSARPSLPTAPSSATPRSIDALLSPLDALAAHSSSLLRRPFGSFVSAGRQYEMPRYLFLGPKGGGDILRLGIFATLHGDEPEGALSVVRLLEQLEQHPEIARGYVLFLYPVCNPTGYEDATRHSRDGRDLNRQFWTHAPDPEVQLLETEIWSHAFHGLISLHSDDTSEGAYGFVNGPVLSEYLLEPALRAAASHLPRNRGNIIDGFTADRGIINASYAGVLRAVPGMTHPPFEITFETPQRAPQSQQVAAGVAALETILVQFRQLLAFAQNI